MKLTKPQPRNVVVDGATVRVWDAMLQGLENLTDVPLATLPTRTACVKWCHAHNEELRAAGRQAKTANAGMASVMKCVARLLEADAALNDSDRERWFQANVSDEPSGACAAYDHAIERLTDVIKAVRVAKAAGE